MMDSKLDFIAKHFHPNKIFLGVITYKINM